MEVKVAEHAGYCYGVERAFKMIQKVSETFPGKICTLGPIIHNPQAVEALKKERGVSPVPDVSSVSEGALVIRTHGVPPEVIREAERKGLKVVDATCPFVATVQQVAKRLVEEGYYLIIEGERDHPEVVGILGYAGGKAKIVERPEDVERLEMLPNRVGVVVQTTQEVENLQRIALALVPRCKELRVYNTICSATKQRQAAARRLAEEVDLMLVVGGRNSGNTRRLFSVCAETGTRSLHIETAEEIDPSWFEGIHSVGVTAGASTPDFIVEEVVARLETL